VLWKEGTSYSPKCKEQGSYPKRRQRRRAKLICSRKTHWVGASLVEGYPIKAENPLTQDSAPIRN
jgi:hypothetical protein